MTGVRRTKGEREADLFLRQLAVLEELKRQLQVDVPLERARLEAELARLSRDPRPAPTVAD